MTTCTECPSFVIMTLDCTLENSSTKRIFTSSQNHLEDFKGWKIIRLSASITVNTLLIRDQRKNKSRLPIYVISVCENDGDASLQILLALVPIKRKFVMENSSFYMMKNLVLGYIFFTSVFIVHPCASPTFPPL